MRIALIQQRATRDKAVNLARGLAAVDEAARRGAALACVAELAFEWFHPQHPASGEVRGLAEPIDGPVARAGQGTDEILFADIDLTACSRSQAKELFMKHRRPELYGAWLGR